MAVTLFGWACTVAVVASCGGPGTGEHRGAQTPAARAVPPPDPYFETDGPTQPRGAAARPPNREEGDAEGEDEDDDDENE